MLLADVRAKVVSAFRTGTLRVRSVSPEGECQWKRVLDVQRAEVGPEPVFEVEFSEGSAVLTGGHRVFTSPTSKVETEKLSAGSMVLSVNFEDHPEPKVLKASKRLKDRAYMYDLTAEDWHNFVLNRSRIVVSNSPDRNYHFRPPAHEATVGQFNQVFGFIWEDDELREYLERGVDMIAAAPPRTPFRSCDELVRCYPEWRTLLLNGAMMHAIMALILNWISDEFSYSIGGVSLDIEKSAKYESAYSQLNDQFDKQLERAKATVKIVKGLQQPKYGMGIRSSFGPHVGRGVLSPRKFVGF